MNIRTAVFAFIAIMLAGLAGSALAADTIYRSTDSQGNPVFSDSAPENASQVDIQQTQTYKGGQYATEAQQAQTDGDQAAHKPSGPPYAIMRITSPENQTSIRDNAGNVQIAFELKPGLKKGQRLVLLMDGKPVQEVSASGPINLSNVDRGTHTVQLQAVDPATAHVLQSSPAVTFTLHRHSILQKKPKL